MAANGVGVPTQITLAGTELVHGAGPNYSVTLSLGGTATVVITSTIKDIAGNVATYTGAKTYRSYNTARATFVAGTITAVAVGQALVEVAVPSFDGDGANALATGKVYALVLVTVTP